MSEWDVGPSSALKEVGDFLTFKVFEVPILVVKAWDGQCRAFINLCRHHKVKLEWDEKGHCESILECPFHGWTYSFYGENLSPGLGEEMKLHALPIREYQSRLFVRVNESDRNLCRGIG